jgi:hypothetical protein
MSVFPLRLIIVLVARSDHEEGMPPVRLLLLRSRL